MKLQEEISQLNLNSSPVTAVLNLKKKQRMKLQEEIAHLNLNSSPLDLVSLHSLLEALIRICKFIEECMKMKI